MEIKKNDVVQFTENHKWRGCLGIVEEVKKSSNGVDARLLIGVPVPEQGIAYIFSLLSDNDVEKIGVAAMIPE